MHVQTKGQEDQRPDEPLPCTGARARRLTRRLTAFYEDYLRAVGLRLPQFSLLVHLDEKPRSIGELAARLEIDRTTLTRSFSLLIRNGWVEAAGDEDARRRCYVLSASGRQLRSRARRHWEQAQLALEAQLGRDFVARLNDTLESSLARLKPVLPEEN